MMNKRHEISAFCLLFIGVIGFTSCNMIAKSRSVSFDRKAFDASLTKWEESGGENYSYIYSEIGFLSDTYRIEVVDGAKTVEKQRTGSGDFQQSDDNIPASVEELFNSILNFYERHNGVEAANNEVYYTGIRVEYDSDYGYPTEIIYDRHVPDNLEVDGNFHRTVSDFSFME